MAVARAPIMLSSPKTFLHLSAAFSAMSVLTACGGSSVIDGPSPTAPPGSSAPSDALACASEPEVTELARESRPALPQVVTDGAFAYWSRRGAGSAVEDQIVRAPLTGGAIEVLVSDAAAQGLAVDDAHVYWTERNQSATENARVVARIAKAGGVVEDVVTRRARFHQAGGRAEGDDVAFLEGGRIAIDGDGVIFTGTADVDRSSLRFAGIFRVTKAPSGGLERRADVAVLSGPEPSPPVALAVHGTSIYWVADAHDGDYADERVEASLRTASITNPAHGAGQVLASGPTFESKGRDVRFSLAADDASVYWLSQRQGAVMKVPSTGGAPIVLAADQQDFSSIAVGGGSVYWAWTPPSSATGGVRRVPTSGGIVRTLASDLWLMGVAYDSKGLVLTGSELSRVTTCR
jgi:hypothetical protein